MTLEEFKALAPAMTLEDFKALDPEIQRHVLAERNRQIQQTVQEEVAPLREAYYKLVPEIPIRHSVALPPVINQEDAVRELMRRDTTITEITTSTGVVYRR